jgi:hypothetical protein
VCFCRVGVRFFSVLVSPEDSIYWMCRPQVAILVFLLAPVSVSRCEHVCEWDFVSFYSGSGCRDEAGVEKRDLSAS